MLSTRASPIPPAGRAAWHPLTCQALLEESGVPGSSRQHPSHSPLSHPMSDTGAQERRGSVSGHKAPGPFSVLSQPRHPQPLATGEHSPSCLEPGEGRLRGGRFPLMEYFILRERLNLCTEKRETAESAAGWGAAGSAVSIWLRHSTSALHPPAATLRRAASSPSTQRTLRTALPRTGRRAVGSTGGGWHQPQPPRAAGQPHTHPLPCCQAPSEPSTLCHWWAAFLPPSAVILGTARTGWQEVCRHGCARRSVPGQRGPDLALGTALGRQRRSPARPSPSGSAARCLPAPRRVSLAKPCPCHCSHGRNSRGSALATKPGERQRGHSLLTHPRPHTRAREEQACEGWTPPS